MMTSIILNSFLSSWEGSYPVVMMMETSLVALALPVMGQSRSLKARKASVRETMSSVAYGSFPPPSNDDDDRAYPVVMMMMMGGQLLSTELA